jgi:hypothetical protein
MEIIMATPKYELTEPFYDNLVLWDSGDVIEWDGAPSPSMIPLNAEAGEAMEKMLKSKGENYEYVPPVSELADTMDGRRDPHNDFHPGNRKNTGKRGAEAAGFPSVPGAVNSPVKGASGARVSGKSGIPPMAQMPQMPVKPTKNFDRAPK